HHHRQRDHPAEGTRGGPLLRPAQEALSGVRRIAMYEPKPLTREGIPRALERAERYRLLNEPVEAESICLDVLDAEAQNPQALVMLLLALTDQFEQGTSDALRRAREVLEVPCSNWS